MVPGKGLEPPQCYHRWILNPLRLPFRHPGNFGDIIRSCQKCQKKADLHLKISTGIIISGGIDEK